MLVADTRTPELQAMPPGLYALVQLALLGAGFEIFAHVVHSWSSLSDVSPRYRPSVLAGLCLAGVAAVACRLLSSDRDTGFHVHGDVYVPNEEARNTLGARYIDWSVTVPLLTVELLAVGSVAGARARNLRFGTMAAAFLIILTGDLSSQVLDQGRDTTALAVWGLISTVFFGYLSVALMGAVRTSLQTMGAEAATSLRDATIVLLGGFGVPGGTAMCRAPNRSTAFAAQPTGPEEQPQREAMPFATSLGRCCSPA